MLVPQNAAGLQASLSEYLRCQHRTYTAPVPSITFGSVASDTLPACWRQDPSHLLGCLVCGQSC